MEPSEHQLHQKKVLIETWGCQMNVADSETMLSSLEKADYALTNNEADADLIVLNTCHIREKAKHKVLSRLGVLRELKDKNPKLRIAVAGCIAQAEGKKLFKDAPQIDILLGPGKIQDLPQLLSQNIDQNMPQSSIGFAREAHQEDLADIAAKPSLTGKNEVTRYVNIAQGCDNFCTFCVVPFTRGREISKMPAEIIAECKALVAQGAKEITLLGQNVNSYGLDLLKTNTITCSNNGSFVDLLKSVSEIDGLLRVRFTTSNPHDFTEPLATLFGEQQKLGKYIHLPVQSGNDTVLERMKRKVTVDEYMQRVAWLRAIDPTFALSTDLIVGFPGETEEQFEDTVSLVEKVRFSFIFSFMYSPRKNTAAYRFREQVPEDVKQKRLQKLNAVQNAITIEENLKEIGAQRKVLFLYHSKKRPGSYFGRSEQMRLVRVDSDTDLVGKEYSVLIKDANKTALSGVLV